MMRRMVLAVFPLLSLAAVNPQLEKVQAIYILPMSNGMDQFLANRLTRFGKFQVVADPKAADTILTDRIGVPFEQKLDELYPPPKPEATDEDDDDSDTPKKPALKPAIDMGQARVSSFSRGRGTFFLVDRKTRTVIWSTYDRARNSTPNELNKIADQVVSRLKKDAKPPSDRP